MSLGRALSLSAVLAMAAVSTRARADEAGKRACVRANEEGQDLRRDGKLLDARNRFTTCSTPSCPNILRQDCIVRRDEVERAIPAIRFIVMDSRRARVPNASVTVDGIEVGRRPDEAIEVDPGEHTFEVTLAGHERAVRRFALREGDGRRDETIVLQATEAAPSATSTTDPYRVVAYGIGGVGVVLLGVGTYFGLAAKSTYDEASSATNCPRGPASCNDAALEGAKRADDQAAVSTATFIVGGLLVAGGVVLYFTAPTKGRLSIAPSLGTTLAGVEARARW